MLKVVVKSQTLDLLMNSLSRLIISQLILLLSFDHVEAQTIGAGFPSDDNTDFQPSLAVVIGILAVMFVLTFLLLAYAKFCHRRESADLPQNQTGLISSSNRFSGIDKTVIESLPFFRFSSLKGSKEGLECAVCLSKFEDVEILRLLPKCKHAFHIACIDHWLEKHSSCPLCRHRVSSEDLTLIAYSDSMRFLWNNSNNSYHNNGQSELGEDSNMEFFVQREESQRGSSRFSIGSSFRKIQKGVDGHDDHKEERHLMKGDEDEDDHDHEKTLFHKHNHKIVVSDFAFKNRWSNVSSSDLMLLNSEMLNDMSSGRFASLDPNPELSFSRKTEENDEIVKIKEEMEIKKSFESKVGTIKNPSDNLPHEPPDGAASSSLVVTSRSVMKSVEQRSVSEITALSRYGNLGMKNGLIKDSSPNSSSSLIGNNNAKEERIRRVWLPIARRTVQWFANRERIRSQHDELQNPKQEFLDV